MQPQRTPLKQLPSHREFPQNADFTSAKKDVNKKVNVTVFAADCKQKQSHRYYPIVTLMPDCQFAKHYRKSQEQDIYFRDSQQLAMKILSKQQQVGQASEVNQRKRDKLQAMLQQLRGRKIEREQNENLLTGMKVQTMKAARDLQLLQSSTEGKVQRMKFLIMKQQNCIFQWNRHIYSQEKEREALAARLRDILTKKSELEQQITGQSAALSAKEKEEQELRADYQQKQGELSAVRKDLGNHSLHVIVLKMQLAPFMRVAFSAPSDSNSTRKKILEKSSTYWNKKNKHLSKEQIKYFVLLQLYPCWRRLLDRLSYHFVGYKQLLFKENQCEYSNALKELDEYIFQGKAIKYKSFIVLYSPRADIYQRMSETLRELIGLNNGIIQIVDIVFDETQRQNVKQVSIIYTFKGEKRVKTIELVQLRQLTRESLHPYIVSNQYRSDKTSLIKIEVPFCFDSPAERIKVEDVYRMIEREK